MQPFGLYYHIPFCDHICHYCDFAKTARWSQSTINTYMQQLEHHTRLWIESFVKPHQIIFSSVNFGGGTPGILKEEYSNLMALIRPFLAEDAEISLEANPHNCTKQALGIWKNLGFNRLSIGVQTFNADGLAFLKRDHSKSSAVEGIERASDYFSHINVDLIYGWKNQGIKEWLEDLSLLIQTRPGHTSLYALTYAPKTPIGRAQQRGLLQPLSDELLCDFYESARSKLADAGYFHDEVSNWSLEGQTCRHNWLYWTQGHYLGIGTGAFSFLPIGPYGLRFSYEPSLKGFLSLEKITEQALPLPFSSSKGFVLDPDRQEKEWLLEYLSCALRTSKGLDLALIKQMVGSELNLSKLPLQQALADGMLALKDHRLFLHPSEWFREHYWINLLNNAM